MFGFYNVSKWQTAAAAEEEEEKEKKINWNESLIFD